MHPFRAAVEAQDHAAIAALMAEDVAFHSPVVFAPYHGRDTLAALLLAVSRVFEDFHYEREIGADGAHDHALLFRARIGDREVEGCDFLHTDEHGLIDDFTVMVRPLSAALVLAEAMKAQLADAGAPIAAVRGIFAEEMGGGPTIDELRAHERVEEAKL
jgi:SnoaL-like domain